MKALLTCSLLCLFATSGAFAQSPYTLTAATETYTPLTGATSANGSAVWSTDFFTMPLGFSAKLGNTPITKVITDGAVIYADTAGTSVDLFQTFFAYTVDRGLGTTISRSPMRYITTGTAPNRIFKYEVTGAGFYEEQQMYSTFNDSFNFQFWLHEGSNIAELHFGPSKISHAADYFQGGQPSFTGYFNVDFTTGMGNIGYFAAGPVAAPYTDSFTATHMPAMLSAYPPSGTVYRFTPITPSSIQSTSGLLEASVYPTICNEQLFVNYTETGDANYRILTLSGTTAGEGSIRSGNNTIAIHNLPAGMYMIRLQSQNKSGAYRFVKQ